MFQIGVLGMGLALVCLSITMTVAVRPRKGVVVGFLDGKPNAQAYYAMALTILLTLGVILPIWGAAE
jgi:hypothetical protein